MIKKVKIKTLSINVRLADDEYNTMIRKATKWAKKNHIDFSYSAFVRFLIKEYK